MTMEDPQQKQFSRFDAFEPMNNSFPSKLSATENILPLSTRIPSPTKSNYSITPRSEGSPNSPAFKAEAFVVNTDLAGI